MDKEKKNEIKNTQIEHGLVYPMQCITNDSYYSLLQACLKDIINGESYEDMLEHLMYDLCLSTSLAMYFLDEAYNQYKLHFINNEDLESIKSILADEMAAEKAVK